MWITWAEINYPQSIHNITNRVIHRILKLLLKTIPKKRARMHEKCIKTYGDTKKRFRCRLRPSWRQISVCICRIFLIFIRIGFHYLPAYLSTRVLNTARGGTPPKMILEPDSIWRQYSYITVCTVYLNQLLLSPCIPWDRWTYHWLQELPARQRRHSAQMQLVESLIFG